jgi:hypothetical protein
VTIIITFTPEQEKKYLEFEFLDKKSNIKDYILKIYDDSNTIIENINGSNLKDRILPKKIISVDKLISKIEIIIISTTDKKPPCRVQISIKGYPTRCESSTKHTTKHLTTSHTTLITTTGTIGPSESSSPRLFTLETSNLPVTVTSTISESNFPTTASSSHLITSTSYLSKSTSIKLTKSINSTTGPSKSQFPTTLSTSHHFTTTSCNYFLILFYRKKLI